MEDPSLCGRACQFIKPDYPKLEARIHGRARAGTGDELFFGPFKSMVRAALVPAAEGAQWTGITTRIGERLLETGAVDAILTMTADADDRWRPVPVLITQAADMAKARGMRMGYAPLLALLETAREAGHGSRLSASRLWLKHARLNFMVPIPEAASFDELNARLEAQCRQRQAERAGRHAETIGERLVADTAALRALPAVPLEPCEKRSGRVSSTALVRYRCNDYSVPTRYGFQEVMVKGFVDEVVILCAGKVIARHPRSYAEGAFIADPLHYLALIEMKPNALDQAAALQNWDLPEVFQHLRHLLEARMGNKGKREFIQVLRLLEVIPKEVVTYAVTEAIHLGAIGFDAVKLIALARTERRPVRLDLAAYPHLPRLTVQTTRAVDYAALVPEMVA